MYVCEKPRTIDNDELRYELWRGGGGIQCRKVLSLSVELAFYIGSPALLRVDIDSPIFYLSVGEALS